MPVLPAGRRLATSSSSSLTRTTNGADSISFGATATPEVCACPVEIACNTVSTLPVRTTPGSNLKVTSTGWPGRDVARIVLRDLDADQGIRRIDEGHHRRQRQVRDPRALAQREIGDIAVGRRAHRGLVEIPLRGLELALELVDLGLPLLDIEAPAGIALEELRHLGKARTGQLQLRLDRLDLRLIGNGSILNRISPAFSGVFAMTGTSVTSPATLGHDRDRIAPTSAGPCGAPHPSE